MLLNSLIVASAITTALIAMPATPVDAAPRSRPPKVFSAVAAFNGPATKILRHGPLTLSLECRHDPDFDRAELIVTSATDGWLATTLPQPTEPLSAADRQTLLFGFWAPGTVLAYGAPAPIPGQAAGATALAASGEILNVPADTVAFGTDGDECSVSGAALRFKR